VEFERYIQAAYGVGCHARPDERVIAAVAAGQHGVVSRGQLMERGFTDRAIGRRLEQQRLVAIHPGVYIVGGAPPTLRGRWRAAVLAAGDAAALSHRSAGAAWDLRAYSGRIEVTAPTQRRSRGAISVHRSRLAPDEVTELDGIPVTTVARTLLDLASVLDRHRLEHAVGEAEKRLLGSSPSLPELIERHRGARGLATLRRVLDHRRIGLDVPESELELEFLAFVAERGLPRPEVNVWIEAGERRFRVDCLWREQGLAVELDSRAHHDDGGSFERDRRRDTALLALGVRTARVTARRLVLDRDGLDLELRAVLSAPTTASSFAR